MQDVNVFGFIGDSFEETSTSASDFARALKEAGGDDVTIHINSCGGDVFDAQTMAETLRAYRGRTTASIEGLAASSASFFALTADEVVINPSALMMIHNPYTLAMGNADEMRKTADYLDKVRETIAGQYVRKSGADVEDIYKMMDEETWFSAREAIEMGLADRMSDAAPVAACITPKALKSFANAPADLTDVEPTSDEPETAEGAGDIESTIPEADEAEPETGAVDGDTGAVSRTVCVNGQFLTY